MTALDRPARLQVDPDTVEADDKPPQTGNTFNIWFLKWAGGDSSRNITKSKFRVSISTDQGYTRARAGSPICLFFARGCCYLGKKCNYYHRLPKLDDYFIPTQDCFGRDKTTNYRDDMDGVGSLNRHNRTLYVGGLHVSDKMEAILTKHFEEFGSVEKIRVLRNKACAFITYKLETEAQFAKEAMNAQSLDDNEIIHVRWANEDPNREAQKEDKIKREQAAIDTIKALLNENASSKLQQHSVDQKKVDRNLKRSREDHISGEEKRYKKKDNDLEATNKNTFFDSVSLKKLKNVSQKVDPFFKEAKQENAESINSILAYASSDDE